MNNFSTFGYDGYGRNISIVETTAGSVTSTKQFVWALDLMRPFKAGEERDGAGTLTKKFFAQGQANSATKYFYNLDHIGSIREMTDNTGSIQAQYTFDPFGRVAKISETIASDFAYSGQYVHARSGLNLATFRAYSAVLSRWLSRDPLAESESIALQNPLAPENAIWAKKSGISVFQGMVSFADLTNPSISQGTTNENEFVYGANNPVMWIDPSGLQKCPPRRSPPWKWGPIGTWLSQPVTTQRYYQNIGIGIALGAGAANGGGAPLPPAMGPVPTPQTLYQELGSDGFRSYLEGLYNNL